MENYIWNGHWVTGMDKACERFGNFCVSLPNRVEHMQNIFEFDITKGRYAFVVRANRRNKMFMLNHHDIHVHATFYDVLCIIQNESSAMVASDNTPLKMFVFIKTITHKTITLKVSPTSIIRYLKTLISEKLEMPVEEQVLMFAGKELPDRKTVADCHISRDETLLVYTKKLTTPRLEPL